MISAPVPVMKVQRNARRSRDTMSDNGVSKEFKAVGQREQRHNSFLHVPSKYNDLYFIDLKCHTHKHYCLFVNRGK